jgi:hypothetical protein
MICCLLIALLSGNVAAASRLGLKLLRAPSLGRALTLIAFIGGVAWLGPAAMAHAGHYVEKARAQERSVLEEILAQPLCTGAIQDPKAPQ